MLDAVETLPAGPALGLAPHRPGLRFWFPHVLLVPFTLLDPPDVVFPSPCPQLPPRRSRQPDVSTIQYIGLLLSCGRPLSRR